MPNKQPPTLESIDAAWDQLSVVLLKPDCVRRDLTDRVLGRLSQVASIVVVEQVRVTDWQIFVHYNDLLVNRDTFPGIDVAECLRRCYVGHDVMIALARGPAGTPRRLRALLGHYDPSQAQPGSIRADLGRDSLAKARAQRRLVDNLVHTSDNAQAARRDFGIWFGTSRHHLLQFDNDTGSPEHPAVSSDTVSPGGRP
jgi:nucleoside-diphosphate kinase